MNDSLHAVALTVGHPFERSSAALIAAARNHGPNLFSPLPATKAGDTVGFVACHSRRALLEPTGTGAVDLATSHQRLQGGALMLLTGRQQYVYRVPVSVDAQMDFGAESPLAAAQRQLIGRSESSVRGYRTSPGRLLRGSDDSALDMMHWPINLSLDLRLLTEHRQDLRPDPPLPPASQIRPVCVSPVRNLKNDGK